MYSLYYVYFKTLVSIYFQIASINIYLIRNEYYKKQSKNLRNIKSCQLQILLFSPLDF